MSHRKNFVEEKKRLLTLKVTPYSSNNTVTHTVQVNTRYLDY